MVENSMHDAPNESRGSGPTITFTPLLTTCDWNEEWKELQKARRAADDVAYWDKRAATFGSKDAPNPYVDQFLALANLQPGESVLDMGCGTGALAVPLAELGHPVIAGDFSRGMLGILEEELAKRGMTLVTPKVMSWEDDWAAHGVLPKSVDVALASRSIATADLKDSLMRLTKTARRRACITLSTGGSPRADEHILNALGLSRTYSCDYLYAFNILVQEGLRPEVSYITSERFDVYTSLDAAFAALERMVRASSEATAEPTQLESALERLQLWLDDNLMPCEASDQNDNQEGEKTWRLKQPRINTWAFIAWNTQDA